jgi:hypothetical protein
MDFIPLTNPLSELLNLGLVEKQTAHALTSIYCSEHSYLKFILMLVCGRAFHDGAHNYMKNFKLSLENI